MGLINEMTSKEQLNCQMLPDIVKEEVEAEKRLCRHVNK